MPASTTVLWNGISVVIEFTSETSAVLLEADFTTGVVTSAVLPADVLAILTERLQAVFAKVPSKAALEAGFSGLVRALVGVKQIETGAFAVVASYAAPTATLTLGDLADPAHVLVAVPHSTQAPFIGS